MNTASLCFFSPRNIFPHRESRPLELTAKKDPVGGFSKIADTPPPRGDFQPRIQMKARNPLPSSVKGSPNQTVSCINRFLEECCHEFWPGDLLELFFLQHYWKKNPKFSLNFRLFCFCLLPSVPYWWSVFHTPRAIDIDSGFQKCFSQKGNPFKAGFPHMWGSRAHRG